MPSPEPLVRSTARRLLVGRTLAALATGMIPTTLTLALIRGGSKADLGIVLACELVPMLLLLPVAGVAADRFRPQRVVLAADLVRAAAQLGIAAVLFAGRPNVASLSALAAVTGAAVAFGTPAVRTLVAAAVPQAERLRMNARIGVAAALAQIAAPAAAGGLMLALSGGWSALVTSVLFVVSATTLGGLRTERPATAARAGTSAFKAQLRDGWTETRRHPWFLANVCAHAVWHLAAGFLLTLGPLIAHDRLGGDTSWVVIVQGGTIGMVAGVYTAPRLPQRHPLVAVAFGAAAYTLPLLAFGLHAPLAVVTAAYLAAMFGLGVLSPLWETEMQRRIPHDKLGRVGSIDAMVSFAVRPLGFAVAAPIAAAVGTTAPLLVAAVLVAGANLGLLAMPDMWTRAPEPADGTAEAEAEPDHAAQPA
ncbi:MFS transporter [Yinghuangia seranimata]|uniref:MFS transporter n=1 Tax=Yinghuangia seranimata TaxID=408067 RepID=UPI00248B9283|nr:MFS transporter [Yinghuangia seranimata]MDI2128287.1 MFS transporter [Yinghuangia seranimata]